MIDAQQILIFMLILTRVSSFIAFFPLFSKKQLPNTIKVGLAAALSFFWLSHVDRQSLLLPPMDRLTMVVLFLLTIKEVSIGVLLAVSMGLMFWPAKVAGAYVGQELGLSLASISDPGSQDGSTLVTRIFETFAILIFFVGNIHHFPILVIHHSLGSISDLASSGSLMSIPFEQITTLFNRSADHGLVVIGPLLILMMLVTLVLAFLNKAAPSLNLMSVGMSLRLGLGITCLFVFTPIVFTAMYHHLIHVQENLIELVGAMSS